jgi:hypothetical protein
MVPRVIKVHKVIKDQPVVPAHRDLTVDQDHKVIWDHKDFKD